MLISKKKVRNILNSTIKMNVVRMQDMKFLKGGFKINQEMLLNELCRELKLNKRRKNK